MGVWDQAPWNQDNCTKGWFTRERVCRNDVTRVGSNMVSFNCDSVSVHVTVVKSRNYCSTLYVKTEVSGRFQQGICLSSAKKKTFDHINPQLAGGR